jgi:hypothetical protein
VAGKRDQRESTRWRALYDAALVEFDKARLPERIGRAQRALSQRVRELAERPCENLAELQAVCHALSALEGLRKISGIRASQLDCNEDYPTSGSQPID